MGQRVNRTVVVPAGGRGAGSTGAAEQGAKPRSSNSSTRRCCHDFGQVAGLPRLLDLGQCNDAYSAIRIALALADEFACGVDKLPLTLVLSWFEQKAVAVLLTLLSLGVRNISLGPTLPAFLTAPSVALLVERFGLRTGAAPGQDPDQDRNEELAVTR
ncbi:MAG: hydroxylamine reductase [Actinomycetota bacterium]|nr:hydroxylamine reductase [Actinomycetota bacterium]